MNQAFSAAGTRRVERLTESVAYRAHRPQIWAGWPPPGSLGMVIMTRWYVCIGSTARILNGSMIERKG
jgi:hypothetical protein